jgi:uncharacterized membrane protein YdjX (TVP38/TMEM64 family)
MADARRAQAAGARTIVRGCFRCRPRGYLWGVPLGTSIFLIAVGAILRYAVTTSVSGIEITTVGLILMIVGVVGLLVSLLWMTMWSPRRGATRERVVERDPGEEPPRTH